jgi:predicted ester cyclase
VISNNPNCHAVTDMLLRQYNDRDLTAVDQYIAEDHHDHNPVHGQLNGRAGVRALIAGVLESADVRCEILDSFGEGDLVATRYTCTIRPKSGTFMGMDVGAGPLVVHIVEIDRLRNLQIIESWGESDMLKVFQEASASASA